MDKEEFLKVCADEFEQIAHARDVISGWLPQFANFGNYGAEELYLDFDEMLDSMAQLKFPSRHICSSAVGELAIFARTFRDQGKSDKLRNDAAVVLKCIDNYRSDRKYLSFSEYGIAARNLFPQAVKDGHCHGCGARLDNALHRIGINLDTFNFNPGLAKSALVKILNSTPENVKTSGFRTNLSVHLHLLSDNAANLVLQGNIRATYAELVKEMYEREGNGRKKNELLHAYLYLFKKGIYDDALSLVPSMH